MAVLKNKFVIIVVVVLVGAFAWYGLSDSGGEVPLLSTETVGGTIAAERGLVETLVSLRAITLSGAIFSDPSFQSLQDFGTQIVPEPIGRRDPFAPLEGTASQNSRNSSPVGPRP